MLRRTYFRASPSISSLHHQHKVSSKKGSAAAGLPYKNSIVIAHGMLGNSNNWSTAAASLLNACDAVSEEGAPLVTDIYQLDMRNHGKSGWSDRHTVWDMAGDIELFCKTVARTEGVDNRVVVVGHSMGGVALMHSIVRRTNRARYLAMEALSDEEMGIQGSMEYVDGTMGGGHTGPLMKGEASSSNDGSSPLIVGGVVVDIVPVSRGDMAELTQDRAQLGGVVSVLNVMSKLNPTTVKNGKEADAFFKLNGIEEAMMRQFILTNLTFDHKNPSNNKWKCNVDVLSRDVHNLCIADELPIDGGNVKVDLDVMPVNFVFGGNSHFYKSKERAISYIEKYFSNVRFGGGVESAAAAATPPLPNVMVVPNVGHNVHYEAPKEFAKGIMPMLQECFHRQ